MIKKLFNITILTLSIITITIASFSYTLFAYTDSQHDIISSNEYISENISNNENININISFDFINQNNNRIVNFNNIVPSLGNQSYYCYNTTYPYVLNSNSKGLFNDAQFNFNTNTDSTLTSASFNISDYPIYYYLSSSYVYIFENGDAFVTEELIQYTVGHNLNPTMSSMRGLNVALGQLGFATGTFRDYSEIYSDGYRQFKQYSFYDIGNTRTVYVTAFAHMGQATNSNIYTNNLNNNYQQTLLIDRLDIPYLNYSSNWSYADFTFNNSGNLLYDKSSNISIININNNSVSCRVYNDGNSSFISMSSLLNSYSTSSGFNNLSINFTFYYDTNYQSLDYSTILNNINTNLIGIYSKDNDILTSINANNTLLDNLYDSIGTININLEDLADANFYTYDTLLDIKDLLSDLQVTEINNIYNDIVNNYNINIDNEINNYIDDLKLDLIDLDINNPKFSLPLGINTQLTGLKDSFSNIFTCFDNSGGSIFYIVPIVALIIGALL